MSTSISHLFVGVMTWCAVSTYPVVPCAGVIFVVRTLLGSFIFEASVTKAVLLVTWYVCPSYSGWYALVIITVLYGEIIKNKVLSTSGQCKGNLNGDTVKSTKSKQRKSEEEGEGEGEGEKGRTGQLFC